MIPRLSRAPRFILLCLPLVLACRHHRVRETRHLPIDGVRFVAHARLLTSGDSLEVGVRAVNTGGAIRTLEFGDCSMNVGVSSVGLTPARKWEYVLWVSSRRPRLGCLDYQAIRDLAPGDSVSPADFRRRVSIRAILGDSLPAGRYRITARVTANGRPSGHLVVGEVELRPPGSRSTAAGGGDAGGPTADPLPNAPLDGTKRDGVRER
jgi:hypothetical protein